MKTKDLLTPLLIFGAFLLIGVWMGRLLGHTFEADQLVASGGRLPAMVDMAMIDPGDGLQPGDHSNAPLPAEALARVINPNQKPPTRMEQHNVLLIGVDDLGSLTPTLESVWLILYIPDLPQITWMPIYPHVLRRQDGMHIEARASVREAFNITNGAYPSQGFLSIIEEEGIWWDYYILVDQTAVIELIDSLGGIDSLTPGKIPETKKSSGSEAFSDLRSTSGNLQEALISQANLIQQLCRIPPESYLKLDQALSIFKQLDDHLKTDLTPQQIIEGLQSMVGNGGRFVCDFPSLLMLSSTR